MIGSTVQELAVNACKVLERRYLHRIDNVDRDLLALTGDFILRDGRLFSAGEIAHVPTSQWTWRAVAWWWGKRSVPP
jgi:hypothetical protein